MAQYLPNITILSIHFKYLLEIITNRSSKIKNNLKIKKTLLSIIWIIQVVIFRC